MEVSIEDKKYIRHAFDCMKNKAEFLCLLNYVKRIIYPKNGFEIQLRQLNYYSDHRNCSNRYSQFIIKKKSGKDRIIHSPISGLKIIQKCLNLIFQTVYEVSLVANGFVPGRSIIDNAQKHVGSNYIYNIDLKDFFPSIDQARIWGRLKAKPFNLKCERQIIGNMISSLCCTNLEVERLNSAGEWITTNKDVLPQGAPTSPVMSNIICGQLDFYLQAVAKRFNLKYSRYADDITFSSMHNVYQTDSEFLNEVKRLIESQNFTIKESKTRLQKRGFRQEVTGLVINEKVNIRTSYVKEIRLWLYLIETYGYEKAKIFFELTNNNAKASEFKKILSGKIEFIKSIISNKKIGRVLLARLKRCVPSGDNIDNILTAWELCGIDEAIRISKQIK